jgi:hypothetical protein
MKSTLPQTGDEVRLALYLANQDGKWITRIRIAIALGWSLRRVRLAAEALGAEIVRGPKGYKLTKDLTAEDMPTARAAVAMARNQAKRMSRTANALEAKLNSR